MADYLTHLAKQHPLLFEVIATLAIPKTDIRFVGGCVRDAILGLTTNDIDLATTYLPEQVMRQGKKAGLSVKPTGLAHGTVSLFYPDFSVEITTLRRDVACDGRHASVAFTSDWEADAARRDFTINAMSLDLDGVVYDYFHGQEDLAQGVVRFIGDAGQRIDEDALRILRYFRFLPRFGRGLMDEAALAACHDRRWALDGLSGERIQSECLRILSVVSPSLCVEVMYQLELLPFLRLPTSTVPQLKALEACEAALQQPFHGLVRLASLLSPMSVSAVAERWRLSRVDTKQLQELVTLKHEVRFDTDSLKEYLVRYGQKTVKEALYLAAAYAIAHETVTSPAMIACLQEAETTLQRWSIPVYPLQGRDLLQAGLVPGKSIGEWLEEGRRYWQAHDYKPQRQEIMDFLQQVMPSK